jgi:hypothetical protein
MKHKHFLHLWRIIIVALALAVLIFGLVETRGQDRVQAADGNVINYLPLISQDYPRQMTVFGAQVHNWNPATNVDLAVDADLYWVRVSAFDWDLIEPTNTTPENYSWKYVKDNTIKQAGKNGMVIIASVRYAPAWALIDNKYACGPIREDAFDDFAEFMQATVERYSAPPYSIKYWEIGNEPDVDRHAFGSDSRPAYGCWGNGNDPYYGGEYYAKMLATVYPAIKQVDPTAKVLVGGLLLDCDPTHPPEGRQDGCLPAKFFEGILHGGGGQYFDIVSFHGYPPFVGSLKWDSEFPGWQDRGGVVNGKINYLREVMSNYGVDKPLIHSEGSLNCPDWEPLCNPAGAAFYEAQADYVARLFVGNWAQGVISTVWYQFDSGSWRYTGLLDDNQQPTPAYHALKFLSQELKWASYVREITQYEGVRAYEFQRNSNLVWVMWSPDEVERQIQLPGNTTQVFDKYGNALAHENNQVTVKSPVYVELAP